MTDDATDSQDGMEDGVGDDGSPQTWTADQLAHVAGTMTTTLRMYQNRGLLHPPTKAGRKAVYDETHLRRLRLIAELQERGHSLAGIADLLDRHERGEPLAQLLGLRSWSEPEPVTVAIVELVRRLGDELLDPTVVQRAVGDGLVEFGDDGRTATVSDRRFLDIGSDLVDLGVSPSTILDEWEHLAETMVDVAARFVAVFEQQLLPTMDDATVSEVASVLDRLADLARDVTVTALDTALRSAAADHLESI